MIGVFVGAGLRMLRARWSRTVRSGDEGVAMAMVVGVGAVMLLVVASMAASSVSGLLKASHDEDWNAAIAAAYAGVSDYQGRLAADSGYVQYGDPASTFGASSPGRAVALPAASNTAFGLGAAGTWSTVAGSLGAHYRYEVDNSSYSQTGVLRLRSTGRVGATVRSIVADLTQQGFIDYLYFTDFEVRDPYLVGSAAAAKCFADSHAWQLSIPRPNSCLIQFTPNDTISGPVHSNDTMVMCGGTFDSAVTTSNPFPVNGVLYSTVGCSPVTVPTFVTSPTTGPSFVKPVVMPASSSLALQQRTDLPLTVSRPGCLYTGPTSITFSGTFMTVRSPWTVKTQVAGSPNASGTAPSACGTPGDPAKTADQNAGTLAGATGVTVAVLDHNMAYVQPVPRVASDPNYWPASMYPNSLPGASFCVGGSAGSSGNGIGFPIATEVAPTQSGGDLAYDCAAGDAFVKGTFDASMTVSASRFVYVTGDLVRQDAQRNVLGLIGAGEIWVYNPVNASNGALLADSGRKIDAALLSVEHSFQVQNVAVGGPRGILTVTGSIAQKFRGTVSRVASGVFNGYTKSYVYDPRLRALAPPKFLSPVSTSYGVNAVIEVQSAFTSTGAGRQ